MRTLSLWYKRRTFECPVYAALNGFDDPDLLHFIIPVANKYKIPNRRASATMGTGKEDTIAIAELAISVGYLHQVLPHVKNATWGECILLTYYGEAFTDFEINNIEALHPNMIANDPEKQVKEGGARYIFTKSVSIAAGSILLSEGMELQECNNGWYAVVNFSGQRLFATLGPEWLDTLADVISKVK